MTANMIVAWVILETGVVVSWEEYRESVLGWSKKRESEKKTEEVHS